MDIAETEFQSVRALALPMMQTAMDRALLTGLRQGAHKRLIIEWSPELRGVIDRAFDISPRVRQFYLLESLLTVPPAGASGPCRGTGVADRLEL
jgi:hypothetical protein